MSTVRDLVYDAMRDVGILGQGDVAPSADDAAVGLRKLQRMLDSWSTDGLMVYALTEETITLSAGDGSYSTTNLSTNTRPVAILGGFIRHGTIDYPLELLTRQQWNMIGVKTTQGIPEWLLYEPTMANGTLEFYPVPSDSMTAYLNCRRALTGTLTLATSLTLPPGYEKAIVDNLALQLTTGSYGVQPSQALVVEARAGKMRLENLNYRPGIMRTMFDGERDYDINAGQ